MLLCLLVLLIFQLFGEVVALVLGWPIPGAVVGLSLFLMMLFLCERWIKGSFLMGFYDQMVHLSNFFMRYFSLLFVPMGVGAVMEMDWGDMRSLEIFAVIFLGTLSTLIFTSLLTDFLWRKSEERDE